MVLMDGFWWMSRAVNAQSMLEPAAAVMLQQAAHKQHDDRSKPGCRGLLLAAPLPSHAPEAADPPAAPKPRWGGGTSIGALGSSVAAPQAVQPAKVSIGSERAAESLLAWDEACVVGLGRPARGGRGDSCWVDSTKTADPAH